MTDSKRLISLDVFRGLTIAAMILVNFPGSWTAIYPQLEHADWVGATLADFIFPFFIFIVGVSVTLSFVRQEQNGRTKKQIALKSFWRAVNIFSIGIALRLLPTLDLSRMELPGVLQRISIVFLACALLFLYSGWKTQLYLGIGILLAYWLTMLYIPVPNFGAGVLEAGKNLSNWLDGVIIPATLLNKKGYDSEGFFSTFPAIVSGISGLLAGHIIQKNKDKQVLVIQLFLIGTLLLLAGNSWGLSFPVIKKIWTSSFVLVTSGWAFLVFACLIWLIDMKELRTGTKPWIIFGSNAIAVYVMADIFETLFVQSGLRNGVYNGLQVWGLVPNAASLVWSVFSVLVCFTAAAILYKRKIFIKL